LGQVIIINDLNEKKTYIEYKTLKPVYYRKIKKKYVLNNYGRTITFFALYLHLFIYIFGHVA